MYYNIMCTVYVIIYMYYKVYVLYDFLSHALCVHVYGEVEILKVYIYSLCLFSTCIMPNCLT